MTPEEIIAIDIQKNNAFVSVEDGLKIFKSYIKDGYKVKQINNTLFLYNVDNNDVYYHSINADPLKKYITNLKNFLNTISDKTTAITTIEEPRLKSVIKKYLSDTIVIKDNYAITNLQEV